MKKLAGKLAVITGASSGLGMSFAEALAHGKCNLVLVARTEAALYDLRARITRDTGVIVHAIPLDLSRPGAALQLHRTIRERDLSVDFLINNAGLGSVGPFMKTAWETEQDMIDLNIRALHQLTKLFLKDMLEQGHGRILNIASTTGFQPMPFFAAYAATKAYVLNLSEALNQELSGTDVYVSALCPGPTKTPFWKKAGNHESRFIKILMMESREVSDYGIELMLSGNPSGIPGLLNKLMVFANRLISRRTAATLVAAAMNR